MTIALLDLFARDADELSRLDATPDDRSTASIARHAKELAEADRRLERVEALAANIRARRNELATRILPELMDTAGTDRVGIPDASADLVVQPYYHAAIKADWDTARRDAAFAHLEELGGGGLVKAEITVSFDREQLPVARKLLDATRKWLEKAKIDAHSDLDTTVNWQRLTGFVRDYTEHPLEIGDTPRPVLKPELLGATIGRVCKIVKRRASSARRRG